MIIRPVRYTLGYGMAYACWMRGTERASHDFLMRRAPQERTWFCAFSYRANGTRWGGVR